MKSFTIRNYNGIEITAIQTGASLISIKTQNRSNEFQNIILAYPKIEDYDANLDYLGCVVGRHASRIKDSAFTIDGKRYILSKNEGMNHLHGGIFGWHQKIWDLRDQGINFLEFSTTSFDGEEGYPGEVTVYVKYTLNDQDQLLINYRATTTKATHVNLTQHTYFNLNGNMDQAIDSDFLEINSKAYLNCDEDKIPTGEIIQFSFKNQMIGKTAYDQTWILENNSKALVFAAALSNKASGRILNVYTTEPSIHLYTGDGLKKPFNKRVGVCLETQHYPNSPNLAKFPSTRLNPEDSFESLTVWEFKVLK